MRSPARRSTLARATVVAATAVIAGGSLTACGSPAPTDPAAAAPAPAPLTPPIQPPGVPGTVPSVVDDNLAGVPTRLGPYTLAGRSDVYGPASDQGLATVTTPGGSAWLEYRGSLDVTAALVAQGWDHIGAPGAWQGWEVDPFQGRPDATMYRVTSPTGTVTEVVHPLAAGESATNSFAALSPDGRWMVTGEWGTVRRLLVLPSPLRRIGVGGLHLAGTIALDRSVRDVQGCAFSSATTLVCTTSDPGRDLWPQPDQVLAVTLDRALGDGVTPATVRMLGQVPMVSACRGTYEPEGDDVDRATGDLRLEVAPPGDCNLVTQVYRYRAPASA